MLLLKRLRNRMLLMNMIFITVLLAAAFTSIYLMTRRQIQESIDRELDRVTLFRGDEEMIPREPPAPPANEEFEKFIPTEDERSISFALLVDDAGAITSVDSFFSADEEFYLTVVEEADSAGKISGRFSLEETVWAYRLIDRGDKKSYSFIDITERQVLLDRLVLIFILVAGASLLITFGISFYLTQHSIKPVAETFSKQKQFIADASHELKTPLSVIGANTDLLLSGQQSADQKRRLQFIKDEAVRMTGLTNDLLYLARVEEEDEEAGSYPRINASELVTSQLLGLEAHAFERGHPITFEIEEGLHVHGSAEQLKQVVMILTDNAIKYSDDDEPISAALSRNGVKGVLTVSNRGKSIPEKEQAKIFDRFYRTDRSRNRENSSFGLGLSIARAVVEQHHGSIGVESSEGKSTQFTVTLPLAKE